jgi:hypothetical protein
LWKRKGCVIIVEELLVNKQRTHQGKESGALFIVQ